VELAGRVENGGRTNRSISALGKSLNDGKASHARDFERRDTSLLDPTEKRGPEKGIPPTSPRLND